MMKLLGYLVAWSGALVLIAACTRVPDPVLAAEETSSATESAAAATLSVALGKETPGPQLTKEECLAAGGEVEQFNIESEYLDAGMRFRVYTPPCYEEERTERYPVLYLIHGQSFNDDQWDRLGADETADELIASGELAPFLIVMPYDVSNYTQPSANEFDESLIEELLPWVDEHYRTVAEREARAVGGLSWGASWAIHLGLTHPELFGAVGGHSPPVFSEEASKVRGRLDGIPGELMPRFWLDIGERDQAAILQSARWFEGLLNERDIVHEWSLFAGDHSEGYWGSHVEMYLRWYGADW